MYRLLKRVGEGTKAMTSCLSSYLREQGRARVEEPQGQDDHQAQGTSSSSATFNLKLQPEIGGNLTSVI